MLNSVESEKSGVASLTDVMTRGGGNASGIALLGTLMNRAYQAEHDGSTEFTAPRGD